MVTEATSQDWTDFWENSMPTTVESLTVDQARQLRDEIIEQVEVAFAIWGDYEFEERAICGIINDAFLDKGIL